MQQQRLQYWPTWLHNDFNSSASLIVFWMTWFSNWFHNVFAKSFDPCVFCFFVFFLFVFTLFGFKQDIWLLQQSIFDLQCNLRDAVLCYYNSTDADRAEIHMIWCCIIFLFHLLIDVLSTFMLWIFVDNKNGPVNKGCQDKHVHFNLQEETRNPAV